MSYDDQKTAMLLTDKEWRSLAHICQIYLLANSNREDNPPAWQRERDLCNRIIEAAE